MHLPITHTQLEIHLTRVLNHKWKWQTFHFLRNATVATREPTDPPNMNVGYVRTWLTYWNGGSLQDSSSLPASISWAVEIFRWLKLSTSCINSSFVLLHDVITLQKTSRKSKTTSIIKSCCNYIMNTGIWEKDSEWTSRDQDNPT